MELTDRHGIVRLCANVNFSDWKYRIGIILEEFDVQECIVNEPPSENAARKEMTDWVRKNAKCKSLLVKHISDSYLEYIKDKDTAKEIFDTLVNLFERKGISNQLYIRKQILTLKFRDGDKLENHFLKFDELVRQLKSSGANPSDDEIICCLFLSMPESYANIITVLEALQEDTLNINLVKGKLLDEERKRLERTSECSTGAENVAFTTKHSANTRSESYNKNKSFRYNCRICGKIGHKAIDCKNNYKKDSNFQNSNSKKNVECFRCHRKGHYANECYSKLENNGSAMNSCSSINFLAESSIVQIDNSNENSKNTLNVEVNSIKDSYLEFIVDSGATDHLVNVDNLFDECKILNPPIKIRVAKENEYLQATKKGTISVSTYVGDRKVECKLREVLFVENLRYNLLSVKKLNENNLNVVFRNYSVEIMNKHMIYAQGSLSGQLYKINFIPSKHCINSIDSTGDCELWHKRFGHLGKDGLEKLVKFNMVNGIKIKNISDSKFFCEACVSGKLTRLPFKSVRKRSCQMFDLIHTDIVGPITPTSYLGHKYYITFLDDYSHFVVVFMLKSKSEVFSAIKDYIVRIENKFGKTIKRFRCDNGREYISNDLKRFCRNRGIYFQYTTPYTPELNGRAERLNRTLNEKARSLLADSGVPKKYWSEAINNAAYVLNRSPTSCVDYKTPAEIWYGSKPNVKNLKVFGSVCFSHVPNSFRSKFDSKSVKCFFLSYGDVGYRVINFKTGKLIYSRNVVFNEDRLYKDEVLVSDNSKSDCLSKSSDCTSNVDIDDCDKDESPTAFNLETFLNDVPNCYEDIKNSPDRDKWDKAVNEELESLHKNKTWTIVDKPSNKNIINSRWVFKIKDDNDQKIYKARLVAKGFEQVEGIDYSEIYTPVAKLSTVRILLAVSNYEKLFIHHMDVKTAFLNGKLSEEIYMNIPSGLNIKGDKVCKLGRALYGLKQAPKCWNDTFNDFILSIGFVRSKNDRCLFVNFENNSKVYLLVYVDDLLIATDSLTALNKLKQKLMNKFEMKDLGDVRNFLGIQVNRNLNERIMSLSQKRLINKVLKRFGVENTRLVKTPIESKLCLNSCENGNITKKPYKELLGCLMFIMLGSRPDIAYAISYFSRFQNCASDTHYNHLFRVLKYLNETINHELIFECNNVNLVGYSDADWANSNDRKSVSGYCFKVFGSLVSWSSRKQSLVALSTTEAEYIALCVATCEMLWIRKILSDLNVDVSEPTVIYEDNLSCIKLVNNFENNKRTKHISIKYYFVKDVVCKKLLTLKYLESKQQISDVFTKALDYSLFEKFVSKLPVRSVI